MKVTVSVTQQDIDKGRAKNVLCCPVALALRRATGKGWTVGMASVSPHKSRTGIALPAEAVSFIDNLDDCADVKPFAFHLDVPDDLASAS